MRRRCAGTVVLVGAVLAVVIAAHLSCSVTIDLEGRSCPCGPGWTCDEERDVCVSGFLQQCGLSEATDRSDVLIENLAVRWRTDEAIELQWTVSDDDWELVDHYDVVVGTDEEAVRTRGEGVSVFDLSSNEHPELYRAALPNTSGGDEVDRVALRDLEPDQTYYLRLTLFDVSGAVSCSAVLEARTWVSSLSNAVLFDETLAPENLPSCVEYIEDTSLASAGTLSAQYRARCEQVSPEETTARCEEPTNVADSCYENLRLRGLAHVETPMSEGQFNNIAHLRIDLALDDTEHAFWSEVGLRGPAPDPEEDPNRLPGSHYIWTVGRMTFVADGQYRTYTAPLSTMHLSCTEEQRAADLARIDAGGEQVCYRPMTVEDARRGFDGVRAGALLAHHGRMRMDHATIHF